MGGFLRSATAFSAATVLATAARADVAPDPFDPASPVAWTIAAIVLVAAGVAVYIMRRRGRK